MVMQSILAELGHRTGKGQFSFQFQRKANAKECSNYRTIALISHASKVMLKILQARFQQYVNHEHPDVQAGFRKGRGHESTKGVHAFPNMNPPPPSP